MNVCSLKERVSSKRQNPVKSLSKGISQRLERSPTEGGGEGKGHACGGGVGDMRAREGGGSGRLVAPLIER